MMDTQETQSSTFLSVLGAICSIGGFLHAHATQSNISWFLGSGAAIVAIWAGIMSARTNYYKTKEIKQGLHKKKRSL